VISVPALAARRTGVALSALRAAAQSARSALSRAFHAIRREHVLWVVLAAALLLFVLGLILVPTGAGRGGR
jgi:hypothetical protein